MAIKREQLKNKKEIEMPNQLVDILKHKLIGTFIDLTPSRSCPDEYFCKFDAGETGISMQKIDTAINQAVKDILVLRLQKREQLKNKIELELKTLIRELYNKPRNTHYWLPVYYSERIIKIMEEYNESS